MVSSPHNRVLGINGQQHNRNLDMKGLTMKPSKEGNEEDNRTETKRKNDMAFPGDRPT
jgi:hypothetical protein